MHVFYQCVLPRLYGVVGIAFDVIVASLDRISSQLDWWVQTDMAGISCYDRSIPLAVANSICNLQHFWSSGMMSVCNSGRGSRGLTYSPKRNRNLNPSSRLTRNHRSFSYQLVNLKATCRSQLAHTLTHAVHRSTREDSIHTIKPLCHTSS